MQRFEISRIDTRLGIFRVNGYWCSKDVNDFTSNLKIKTLELMGTDGWVLLDHSSSQIIHLIEDIKQILLEHLLGLCQDIITE